MKVTLFINETVDCSGPNTKRPGFDSSTLAEMKLSIRNRKKKKKIIIFYNNHISFL